MKLNSIFSVGLAILGLIAFQADQVSHALSSPRAPQLNVESAHAHGAYHSFASAGLKLPSFQKHGHPCKDLGHSEGDCPVANIVDSLYIINVDHFLLYLISRTTFVAFNSFPSFFPSFLLL